MVAKVDYGIVIEMLKSQWLKGEAIEEVRKMEGKYGMIVEGATL